MAKAKRKRKPATKRADSRQPGNDLNAVSRAQLGRDEEKRPYRPLADDASIEDPLKDWPDD